MYNQSRSLVYRLRYESWITRGNGGFPEHDSGGLLEAERGKIHRPFGSEEITLQSVWNHFETHLEES